MNKQSAFSLTETLIALGIFAVGFSAIATLFPVAAMLQKETARDVIAQQIARNVTALMRARPYKHADLDANQPNDLDVHPPVGVVRNYWTIVDRSWGPGSPSVTRIETFHRNFFWVPLIRRAKVPTGPHDWQVYVFILSKEAVSYDRGPASEWNTHWADPIEGYISPNWLIPGVRRMDGVLAVAPNRFNFLNGMEISAGDQILDNRGVVYWVTGADSAGVTVKGMITQISGLPDMTLWYGKPAAPGRSSPTCKIVVLSVGGF